MNISWRIARRYAFSKSRQSVINIINLISCVVLILGTASLFVVLSGFGGLRKVNLELISVANPDILLRPATGKYLSVSPSHWEEIKRLPGVSYASQTVEERVYLYYKGKNFIAYIKGTDTAYHRVIPIEEKLAVGRWPPEKYNCIIGDGIARALGTGVFDKDFFLRVIVPKPGMENIVRADHLPYKELYMTVAGVYTINEEFDRKYVYTRLQEVRQLLGLNENQVSAIEIKRDPSASEDRLRAELTRIFGDTIRIDNVIEQNSAIYKMLNTEKAIIYFIFVLVLLVALFNLSGSLVMMILEKKKNLWTLRCMGLTFPELQRIFFFQGCILTLVSSFLGLALGIGICSLQIRYGLLKISQTTPYPMVMAFSDALMVMGIALSLGALVSWLTSKKITDKWLA